jgi:DNA-binding winged helix-turn-helix (wHTH) protein
MKELASSTYTFAEYELDFARRLLLRAGKSVPLNAKAFDLLLVLIEHRERVLTKEELMELVWRDQFVEEANLTVQISALRKALGEKKDAHRFIVTFPGRGYRFVARVQNVNPKPDAPDIVIETHTTSHVLMEEEVETEPDSATVVNTELSQARVRGTRGSEIAACDVDSRRNQPGVIDVSFTQKLKPFKRRLVAFFAGALGVLLLGALAFWTYKSRNQNQPGTASLSTQLTMRRFTTTGGVPYRVAISPDGKSLVYWQRIGDEGKLSLWLGQIETNSSVQITQPSYARHGHPVFAPDGRHIYFAVLDDSRPEWTLVRMPVVGGVLTELIHNVHSPVSFSPDGQQLAFIRADSGARKTSILIADAADGPAGTHSSHAPVPGKFFERGSCMVA